MDSKKPDFTLFDHTADLGIIVRGRNLRTLFEVAARSMMYIMSKGNLPTQPEHLTFPTWLILWFVGSVKYFIYSKGSMNWSRALKLPPFPIPVWMHPLKPCLLIRICMKYCVRLRRLHFIKSKSLKRMTTGRPGLFSIYKKTSRSPLNFSRICFRQY